MSPPNFMTKTIRNPYSSKLKVSLPNRGYVLAQHLLEIMTIHPFSTKTTFPRILKEQNKSARKNRITNTLTELKKLDCCQNYKMVKSSIGHKCTNQNYTKDFFIKYEHSKKFIQFIKQKEKFQDGEISFECEKCKKHISYKKNQEYEISNYEYWSLLSLGILVILCLPKNSISKFEKYYKNDEILNILDILEKSGRKSIVKSFISKLCNETENLEELIKISIAELKQIKIDILGMKINKSRHKRLHKIYAEIYNNSIRQKILSNRSNR